MLSNTVKANVSNKRERRNNSNNNINDINQVIFYVGYSFSNFFCDVE